VAIDMFCWRPQRNIRLDRIDGGCTANFQFKAKCKVFYIILGGGI
jgi:hypothetical protein